MYVYYIMTIYIYTYILYIYIYTYNVYLGRHDAGQAALRGVFHQEARLEVAYIYIYIYIYIIYIYIYTHT